MATLARARMAFWPTWWPGLWSIMPITSDGIAAGCSGSSLPDTTRATSYLWVPKTSSGWSEQDLSRLRQGDGLSHGGFPSLQAFVTTLQIVALSPVTAATIARSD